MGRRPSLRARPRLRLCRAVGYFPVLSVTRPAAVWKAGSILLLALLLSPGACAIGPDIVAEPLASDDCRLNWICAAGVPLEDLEWRHGRVALGDRTFHYVLCRPGGEWSDLGRLELSFDRDEDGLFCNDLSNGEGYEGDERFDLGTGTFMIRSISEDGEHVVFAKAWPPTGVHHFLASGDPAPALPAEILDGSPISLDDFLGQEVLLCFWGSG